MTTEPRGTDSKSFAACHGISLNPTHTPIAKKLNTMEAVIISQSLNSERSRLKPRAIGKIMDKSINTTA